MMTCKEVLTGNGDSRVENTADKDDWDEFDRGYARAMLLLGAARKSIQPSMPWIITSVAGTWMDTPNIRMPRLGITAKILGWWTNE